MLFSKAFTAEIAECAERILAFSGSLRVLGVLCGEMVRSGGVPHGDSAENASNTFPAIAFV
jgi:hypothetical protein